MIFKHLTTKKTIIAIGLGVLFLVPNYSPTLAYVYTAPKSYEENQAIDQAAYNARKQRYEAEKAKINQEIEANSALLNELCASQSGSMTGKANCNNRDAWLAEGLPNNEELWRAPSSTDEEDALWRDYELKLRGVNQRILEEELRDPKFPDKAAEVQAAIGALQPIGDELVKEQVASQEDKIAVKSECGWDIGACIYEFVQSVIAFVFDILIWLFRWVLYFANEIFSRVLKISIVDFSKYASMPGVEMGWKILRDLLNIVFIGALFYIAIGTILQLGGMDWKKMVTSLIVAALLVNFSMVFTKIIIDATNILALTFYNSLSVSNGVKQETNLGSPDITTQLISGLSLHKNDAGVNLAPPGEGPSNPKNTNITWTQTIAGGIGTIILILVTAFVLIAASVMFLARTIVLVFLLVLSPIAFIGWILPQANKYQSMWWKKLMDTSLFAPAYLFCFFVVVKIVTLPGPGGNLKAQIGSDGSVILYFIIIIALMMGCLFIAKEMGATGADFAKKAAGKWVGGPASLLAGSPGWMARNTLGRGAAALGRAEWLQKAGASKNVFTRTAAMGALVGADKLGKASMDIRSLAGEAGIKNVGDAQKGGFKGSVEEASKRAKERAKLLTPQTDLEKEEVRKRNEDYINDAARQTELAGYNTTLDGAKTAIRGSADYQAKFTAIGTAMGDHQQLEREVAQAQAAYNSAVSQNMSQTVINAAKSQLDTKQLALTNAGPAFEQAQAAEREYIDKALKSGSQAVVEAYNKRKDLVDRGTLDQDSLNKAQIKARSEAVRIAGLKGETDPGKLKEIGDKAAEKSIKDFREMQEKAKKHFESGGYAQEQLAKAIDSTVEWQSNITKQVGGFVVGLGGLSARGKAAGEQMGATLGRTRKEAAAGIRKQATGKSKADLLLDEAKKQAAGNP